MKIKEIYKEWAEYKKNYVKKSSFSAYMLLVENHILPQWGEYENITDNEVQEYVLKKIASGLSHKTVRDQLIVLKMLLKYGKKKGYCDFGGSFDIQFPTNEEHSRVETLNIEEYRKIIKHINEYFSFRNLGILMVLSTGMRIGEICGLRWEDIDMEEGFITVNRTVQRIYTKGEDGKKATEVIIDTPKTRSSNRQIPLSTDLMKIFKPLQKLIVNKEFYVLTNDRKLIEPRTYRNYFMELMQKLELPVLKFHGLRHTFATRCIGAKIDVKTVSVLLGHANVGTTFNLYVHPNLDQKRDAINQLQKAMR